MRSFSLRRGGLAVLPVVVSCLLIAAPAASARSSHHHGQARPHGSPPPTLYVSGSLSGYGHGSPQCMSARYSTIQSAVDAASSGSKIVVCPGTYDEGVVIGKTRLAERVLRPRSTRAPPRPATVSRSSARAGRGARWPGSGSRTRSSRGSSSGPRRSLHRNRNGETVHERPAGERRDDRRQHV